MFKITAIAVGLILWAAPLASAKPINPEGIWRLDSGRITVKVTHCNGNNICANIVALASPNYPDGTPLLDALNPNSALRKRPVMGLPVINGMVQTSDDTWKGAIYNADDGGTYRAYATIKGKNLQVKGCWTFFCKDLNFLRVK